MGWNLFKPYRNQMMALAKLTEWPNQLIPNVVQEFSEPWNHLVYYDDKFKPFFKFCFRKQPSSMPHSNLRAVKHSGTELWEDF